MKQQKIRILCTAAGILILILDGKTALAGAQEGMELCLQVLIPSLFPFFVLSALLSGTLVGNPMPLLQPLGKLCGIPTGAESLLVVGFLGGYPVGAQNIGTAYRSGDLEKADAERMLGFCSNAGPAFIFGVLGSVFSEHRTVWILWLTHILSALLVGLVLRERTSGTVTCRRTPVNLTTVLERSVRVMASVSGWVVLLRILLSFLNRWVLWVLPVPLQIFLTGMLELSNGCVQLSVIESEELRFLVAALLLAFGGLCVTMQTATVTQGLAISKYCCGKLLQACFSYFLCMLFQFQFPVAQRCRLHPLLPVCIGAVTLLLIAILRRTKKTSRFPDLIGV